MCDESEQKQAKREREIMKSTSMGWRKEEGEGGRETERERKREGEREGREGGREGERAREATDLLRRLGDGKDNVWIVNIFGISKIKIAASDRNAARSVIGRHNQHRVGVFVDELEHSLDE